MRLFIDGDAFPNLLKPIVSRAIKRLNLHCIVISNKKISIDENKNIEYIIVDLGADEADNKIVEMLEYGDFVITADIPLADKIISKDAHALDHRGELFTKENIKQLLAIRNLMQEIRESGEITKGPKAFSAKDAHAFSNSFNAFLAKNCS